MDTSRSSEHAPCLPSHPERWRNILHPDAAHDLHNSHRAIIAHVPATPDGRVTSNTTLKQKEAIISVNGSSSGGERTYFSIYDPDGTRPHPRPKRYGCPQCTKMFDRPSARDLHILVHTGEKPHECSLCERRFSTVSNRNRHMR
ncbi:uncharacterized protein EI90DRAFT_2952941, partial [Cantharellus anzutake]|uniref:uncharacterized protein n=1 Tax=Cantharellus anzutake TaxID=1750568 RepID=UPI001907362D